MFLSLAVLPAFATGDTPAWMHAVINAPVPEHDDKAQAVLMYSETNLSVLSADIVKRQERRVYKILRPEGKDYGTVITTFNAHEKVTSMHGWSVPVQGKDYEVKDKEAVEASLPKIEGAELVSDVRAKILLIPGADAGAIVGYEYEVQEHPLFLQDTWYVQHTVPARESHYSLQLPAGWEYRATWIHHAAMQATEAGANLWRWTVGEEKAIPREPEMPPYAGVAGQMILTYFPAGNRSPTAFVNWRDMGTWYQGLTSARVNASPELKQKVSQLTEGAMTQWARMGRIAEYVQDRVRYVAIVLGVGGFQPHAAANIFSNSYGDCKDKATLMMSMLREIGVSSYYVVINAERGAVSADTPVNASAFNHVVLAVSVPDGASDPNLIATIEHPKLGKLLFFDPTNEVTPLGHIGGYLQGNYGLLVGPDGGELVELPRQPTNTNGITRTARLSLDVDGTLKGEVNEMRVGDRAMSERQALRTATAEQERLKRIEKMLGNSLTNYRVTKASIMNLTQRDQVFGYSYTFEAERYAKNAGSLVLVRPRVIGTKSQGLLETKEARTYPIEFEGPARDTDMFEIALPAGYEVDELPPPVDVDYSFASYHSKTEARGNVVRYTRTFELKEVSVPVSQADELKKFYRLVATDERSMAVLKSAAK